VSSSATIVKAMESIVDQYDHLDCDAEKSIDPVSQSSKKAFLVSRVRSPIQPGLGPSGYPAWRLDGGRTIQGFTDMAVS
jgi:hypothetical protein